MAEGLDTAAWYRRFALVETRGYSPTYEQWCTGISEDPHLLALLDDLPAAKRQPNLLLGAARFHGAQPTPYPEFRGFLLDHWAQVKRFRLMPETMSLENGLLTPKMSVKRSDVSKRYADDIEAMYAAKVPESEHGAVAVA